MAHLEGAFEQFDLRFDTLDGSIDRRFMWTVGIILGTWLTRIFTVFAVAAHR